jgi:hypothetical protein
MNELKAFAAKLVWTVHYLRGVRRAIALASSEEEAAAWMEWMRPIDQRRDR